MKYLTILFLLLSACAKQAAIETAPPLTCDYLNSKYADKSESELLDTAKSYDETAITLADSEYFSNQYINSANELRMAAECK